MPRRHCPETLSTYSDPSRGNSLPPMLKEIDGIVEALLQSTVYSPCASGLTTPAGNLARSEVNTVFGTASKEVPVSAMAFVAPAKESPPTVTAATLNSQYPLFVMGV